MRQPSDLLRRVFVALSLTCAASYVDDGARSQEATVVQPAPGAGVDAARVARDIDEIGVRKDGGVILLPDQAKAGRPPPAVPMFAPPGVIELLLKAGEKGDRPASPAANGCNVPIDYPDDGYAVDCRNDRYQVSVRGTNKSFTDEHARSKAPAVPADYLGPFSESEGGGTISFGYAGAHYIAAFECASGKADCITAAEANRVIADFVLCGLGNKCVERGTVLIRR
ncbi:MAG: hypothetical protein WA418_11930 [Bradyrhizobium sp.]